MRLGLVGYITEIKIRANTTEVKALLSKPLLITNFGPIKQG